MPRYFFHLRDHDILVEDSEGMGLSDLNAALEEALRVERELMTELAGIYGLEFEIADSSCRVLLKVPIQERRRSRSLTSQAESDEQRRRDDKARLTQ